jgi:hypothetical protein
MIIHLRFCIAFLFAFAGQLQISYSQSMTSDTTKANAFRGSVGLDFRFSGGNIKQSLIRGNASVTLEEKSILFNPYFLFTQNVIFGNKLEADVFFFLLIKVWHRSKIYPVASLVYESSLVRSIDKRYMGGAGVGWRVVNSKSVWLELIQLVMYEETRFAINNDKSYKGARTHTSVNGKYSIVQDRLSVEHRIFYSLLLRNRANNRLRALLTLRVPVTKKILLTANLDYVYESIVDERRSRENYISTGGISFQF